jgi:hypothetical protein
LIEKILELVWDREAGLRSPPPASQISTVLGDRDLRVEGESERVTKKSLTGVR